MPKTSLEGSMFPGLEQEQRSVPHPKRAHSPPAEKSNNIETVRKTKKSEEIDS